MPATWDRPVEAKTPKTADQLSPRDRFRHGSRGSGRQADPTDSRDRIVVADLQDKPFFECFLKHLAARVKGRFVRPDPGQSRNVAETGAVFDGLVSSSFCRFADVTSQHRFHHTKAGDPELGLPSGPASERLNAGWVEARSTHQLESSRHPAPPRRDTEVLSRWVISGVFQVVDR